MKILFDHQIFSLQRFGGISRYIFELSDKISAKNQDKVFILAPLFINEYLKFRGKLLCVIGFQIKIFAKVRKFIHIFNYFFSWPIVRILRPDIVHETYYTNFRLAPKSTKVVLTVYDMIHEHFPNQFSIFDKTSSAKRKSIERADHIICISNQTREDLINLINVDPKKISVIYLGFELGITKKNLKKLKVDFEYLLFVGARDGYKNFRSLLHAYSSSDFLKSNYHLVCFGGGQLTNSELNLLRDLNIPNHKIHQISGNDKLLAEHYSSASAFIYPSLYEGFGIPPLEAMSFNCPVVCSNTSSIPEIVGDAGFMFDPYDKDSIKNSIEKVLKDNALKANLIKLGKKRLRKFSWKRCAEETSKVYRKLIK